jgi:hypothetical protein
MFRKRAAAALPALCARRNEPGEQVSIRAVRPDDRERIVNAYCATADCACGQANGQGMVHATLFLT